MCRAFVMCCWLAALLAGESCLQEDCLSRTLSGWFFCRSSQASRQSWFSEGRKTASGSCSSGWGLAVPRFCICRIEPGMNSIGWTCQRVVALRLAT